MIDFFRGNQTRSIPNTEYTTRPVASNISLEINLARPALINQPQIDFFIEVVNKNSAPSSEFGFNWRVLQQQHAALSLRAGVRFTFD